MGKKWCFLVLLSVSFLSSNAQQALYSRLEGSIGKYPVVIHLHGDGQGQYSGFYYYKSAAQPVSISGSDSIKNNRKQVYLFGILPGDTAIERFVLHRDNAGYSGTWESGRKGVPGLPVKTQLRKQEIFAGEMIHSAGSEPLHKGQPNSPEGSFEILAVRPLPATMQRIVCALLGDSATADISGLIKRQQQAFFRQYHEDNRDVPDSEWMDHPYAYNNEETTQVLVAYDDGQIADLATTFYAYMGGAHGLYATRYTPVDLRTGKELTLDDILLPSGKAKLNGLLARRLRQQAGLKPGEPLTEAGLFEDKIEANDNFFVTASGIGFNYTPYEIAPYAAGEIQIFLSFKDLEKDLRPAFVKKRK